MHPDQPAPVPGLTREQAQRWAVVQPEDSGRILVGDCPERAAVVAGLRALAGYLAANPAVPVPPYGWEVFVHAEGTDSEQFSQVDLVGEFMGERPADRRAASGHHHAARSFGPVTYRVVCISEDGSRVDVLFVGGVGLGVLVGGPRAGLWVRLSEQTGFGLDEDAAAGQSLEL
jgi:hypothetical protein